jgi:threonyl-tRNA synthetase
MELTERLNAAGLRVVCDRRNEKINYKVREHSAAHIPAILAVGRQEVEAGTVAVRRLGHQGQRVMPLEEAAASLAQEALAPDLAG